MPGRAELYKNIINADTLAEALALLSNSVKGAIGCEHICVILHDRDNSPLPLAYSVNLSAKTELLLLQLEQHTGFLTNKANESGFFAVSNFSNPKSDISPVSLRSAMLDSGIRAMQAFPLNNRMISGLLLFFHPYPKQLKKREFEIYRLISMHINQLVEKIQFRKQFVKRQSYENLFSALRMKDPYTVDHCYNVAFYSSLLGRRVGLSEAELDQLKIAALLHDVGKLSIPDAILLKPGRLTEEEFRIVRQHPSFGYELLKDLPQIAHTLPIVRWHHERIDGRGYPDGLEGSDIPFSVRIVSLADAFDAMTSHRVYRHSLSVKDVKDQLVQHAGTQFDEMLAYRFLDIVDEQVKMMETFQKPGREGESSWENTF